MDSLSDITPAETRQAAFEAMAAEAPSAEAKEAAAKEGLRNHFLRALKSWASAGATDPGASRRNFSVREVLLDQETLNGWELDLIGAGYTVTRDNGLFVVSFAA